LEMPPLLDHPRRRTVEAMVVPRREVNDGEKERVPGLDAHRAAPWLACAAGKRAARAHFFRDRGVIGDGFLDGSIRLHDGRIDPHAVLVRQRRRRRPFVRLWIGGEFQRGRFLRVAAGHG